MPHDKSAVRKILEQAKAAGRESLTAPEARGVCEAYGIAIPKEGVAKTADEARQARRGDRLSGRDENRLAADSAQDRGRRSHRRRQIGGAGQRGLCDRSSERPQVRCQGRDPRRSGAADARRRPGSHHRRRHRSGIRQAGGFRARRDSGRSAQGHYLPARSGDRRRRALDARRDRSGGDFARRARREGGRSRGARRHDRAGVVAGRGFSRNIGDGFESGIRDRARRHRRGRAHRARLQAGAGALSPEPGARSWRR